MCEEDSEKMRMAILERHYRGKIARMEDIMLKSMTGFGRYELSNGQFKITVEMKSVNHRYLDLNIKMPKKFNYFEAAIRNLIKTDVQRGKVDLFLTYESYTNANVKLKYNDVLAQEYMECFQTMHKQFGIENDIHVSALASFPEVLTMENVEEDVEELWSAIEEAVNGAAARFVETRILEGRHLKEDLLEKLNGMKGLVERVESHSPEVVKEYQYRLETKIREMLDGASADDTRILTEVAMFADKICVDEELVRLKSHIKHMEEVLSEEKSIGRKLDFIAQEMNREANTLLSKSNDMEVSDIAIELKTEIEKVREQIQNIE